MLAERRNALLSNQEKWKEKAGTQSRRSSDVSAAKASSLDERKAALLQASGGWKTRVHNDDSIKSLSAKFRLQTSHHVTPETSRVPTADIKSAPRHTRFFPSKENKDRVKNDAAIYSIKEKPMSSDQESDLQRSAPLIVGVRRPTHHGRRPPSSVEALSVNIAASSESAPPMKRSPASDKENDAVKEPPAKQPFSPQLRNEQTPKLGVKNCGIVLKRPDLKRPYPEVMLIRCKGTKSVDVRLVAPSASSVHDCATFVLVTSTKLLIFEGEFSNLLEKTKAKQIAHSVIASRDLACSASKFELVEPRTERAFWGLLGDKHQRQPVPKELEKFNDPEGGEAFEDAVTVANAVYEVGPEGNGLLISQNESLHSSILDSSKILVFDFGTEIYLWLGHDADRFNSKQAMKFAESLVDAPIPCSEIVASTVSTSPRPDWILIRKFTEGLPDCLFRLKFIDPLPEPNAKTPKTPRFSTPRITFAQKKSGKIAPLPACNLENLLKDEDQTVDTLAERLANEEAHEHVLELEETLLRPDDESIFTEEIFYYQLEGEVLEQRRGIDEFFDDQCYVIKWLYRVERTGIKKLDGTPGIQKDTGRQRIAYFYWFGKNASSKTRGALALALRGLDSERREHVLLEQGCQGAMFLHLFEGKLIISSSLEPRGRRIYIVHGSSATTFYAEEMDVIEQVQLRPQASYIFVNPASKTVSLWNGKLATKEIVRAASNIAEKISQLQSCTLAEFGETYPLCEPLNWEHAPQIFRLFDTTGEQLDSMQFAENVNFTFRQSDLKDTLLVDQGSRLWVWTEELVTTFHLKVADKYWKLKSCKVKPATVICKGKEPVEFQSLFPSWTPWVPSAHLDEFEPNEPQSLEKLLDERTKFRSLDDVLHRRLPRGCDTKNLEKFLSDEDFEKLFKIERNAFYKLPKWKQVEKKKEAQLF